MVNINLTTGGSQGRGEIPYKSGILAVAAIFIVTLAVYGGIYLYKESLVKKVAATANEYAVERNNFTSKNENKEVMDFQNRLLIAGELLAEKNAGLAALAEMEKTVVPGAYLTSFEFNKEEKNLKIRGLADSFGIVSRQLLSFKKSGFFSRVAAGDNFLSEGGKVDFSMELKVK